MPAPRNPSACMGAALAQGWWDRAERLAGLEPKPGRGWHSLGRKFASDLLDQPLKVLCDLGGWKTAKTVLRCYQRADEGQLRNALDNRRRGALLKSRPAGIVQRETGLSNMQPQPPQQKMRNYNHMSTRREGGSSP